MYSRARIGISLTWFLANGCALTHRFGDGAFQADVQDAAIDRSVNDVIPEIQDADSATDDQVDSAETDAAQDATDVTADAGPRPTASFDFTVLPPGPVSLISLGLGFGRASVASVQVSSTALVTGIPVDIPRKGSDGLHAGLVFEEARLSEIAGARDFTPSGGWSGSATTPFGPAPDGSPNSSSRVTVAANSYGPFFRLPDSPRAISVWARAPVTSSAARLRAGSTAFPLTLDDSWRRVILLGAGGDMVLGEGRAVAGYATPDTSDGVFDLAQSEVGGFATEVMIDATGRGSSRAGEHLYYPAASALIDSGRLSLRILVEPKGDRVAYGTPMRLWTSGSDFSEIDPTTGVVTVSIGGSRNTAGTVTWNAGQLLDLFVGAGGGLPTVLAYRLDSGAPQRPIVTGSALGNVSPAGTLDILCNGTSEQLSAWLHLIAAYRAGDQPF